MLSRTKRKGTTFFLIMQEIILKSSTLNPCIFKPLNLRISEFLNI